VTDLAPLFVVATIAVIALLLQAAANRRHQAQISALLATGAAERYSEARQRWDLNTRISSPEVVRTAPPAPPAEAPPIEILQALQVLKPEPATAADEPPEDFDESFLVGTGPDGA
jgi:hypothetical protein